VSTKSRSRTLNNVNAARFPRPILLPLLALPIILVSATLSYLSLRAYEQQSSQLEQTRLFLRIAANLREDLRRAESSQRGFLLTGHLAYLSTFGPSAKNVERYTRDLAGTAAKDPQEVQQVSEIAKAVQVKLTEMRKTVELYRDGQASAALGIEESGEGDRSMKDLTERLSRLREFGQERFEIEIQSAGRRARQSFIVSSIGDVVLLIFLIIAGAMLHRDGERRATDETAIRVLNERLGQELKDRTNILESIQDGFCAFDPKGWLTYINPAASRLLGVGPQQHPGMSAAAVFEGSLETLVADAENPAQSRDRAVTAERYLPVLGRWLSMRVSLAADRGTAVFFTDITDEKEAEFERSRLKGEVQEARALLDAVFENAPIGLGLWDRELRFIRVNRALADMNGAPAERHIGKTVAELLPEMDAAVVDSLQQVVSSGRSLLGMEVTGFTPAQPDRERTWTFNIFPILAGGDVVGAGAVCEETTMRKAVEQGMRQAAKLESLGVMAGGVAHDFNNLLTGILGNASLALDLLPDETEIQGPLSDVIVASERAAELTRQLLTYAGKSQFHMEPVNLSDVVTEVQSLVRLSVPRRVELFLDLPRNLPNIIADPAQIQSMVMNLVINAAEAIPLDAPGTVTVSLSSTGPEVLRAGHFRPPPEAVEQYVLLDVRDNGIGMDQATQARIFDPFFTTKFTGRGLGLAATLGALQGHKGSIAVESALGKGTCFRLLFPATSQAVRREDSGAYRNLKGNGTVMVVDDEEVVRRTTKAALERFGYSVVLTENGRDAVDVLSRMDGQISLVLLDLTMPVMSGEQALRIIREMRPEIKVILTSGYDEGEALQRFASEKPAGFLQKPFSVRELGERVFEALSNG
jgi:PAS domain S-box-containing protein